VHGKSNSLWISSFENGVQLLILRGMQSSKRTVEEQVVDNFQCPCDKDRRADQRRPREQKSRKQRTDCRALGARNSRKSTCGRALLGENHRHRIRLSGGNIHLADAEAEQRRSALGA
jgi:hypothetical protein